MLATSLLLFALAGQPDILADYPPAPVAADETGYWRAAPVAAAARLFHREQGDLPESLQALVDAGYLALVPAWAEGNVYDPEHGTLALPSVDQGGPSCSTAQALDGLAFCVGEQVFLQL